MHTFRYTAGAIDQEDHRHLLRIACVAEAPSERLELVLARLHPGLSCLACGVLAGVELAPAAGELVCCTVELAWLAPLLDEQL
jgi:hypothetical protein